MAKFLLPTLATLGLMPLMADEVPSHGDRISKLPPGILKVLAERNVSDETGAMGRNRKGYFHVRFQMGIHHLANYALVAKDPTGIEHFLRGMDYALSHQLEDGRFAVKPPPELATVKGPSQTDLASGVAFFLSSAGTALDALQTSTWVQTAPELEPARNQLDTLLTRLEPSLASLLADAPLLKEADSHAPNRLLFDAAAFLSLGKLLNDPEAIQTGEEFLGLATKWIHEDGYFIEGGGTDTSYNGVAAAIALRIGMMTDSADLIEKGVNAVIWQSSRISADGEISSEGNTRVRAGGESFLGREKDIDVAHTLEALIFAATVTEDKELQALAERVLRFYQK